MRPLRHGLAALVASAAIVTFPALVSLVTLVAFAAAAMLVACNSGDTRDARFTTRFASDFAPTRRTVSVLGVYEDGRMSPEGWRALGPRVVDALHVDGCDVGYNALAIANGPLAAAIDDYARADGPTDDLLAQLSPAAKGDLVLLLTLSGKVPHRGTEAGAPRTAPTQQPGGSRGHGMRGGARMRGASNPESVDLDVLDLSASLYSVAQARSVALVAMQYSGSSLDEAISQFAAKLGQAVPGLLCVGWNWDAKIDPDRIRQSIDE